MFASWKVDYLKSDPCGIHAKHDAIGRFNQRWVDAFTKIGYIDKLHFQGDLVCGFKPHASGNCLNQTATMANSWRTTGDIQNNFSHVMKNIMQNNAYHAYGGPHHWNDPDLLVVGNKGTTVDEQVTQFSLWCLVKAPLIISTDLRSASDDTIAILTNKAAIAVNQDPLGVPGQLVQNIEGSSQVWTGELSGGRYAVVLVNLNHTDTVLELEWAHLPGSVPANTSMLVRDLWNTTGGDLGAHTASIALMVRTHGCRMLVLKPVTAPVTNTAKKFLDNPTSRLTGADDVASSTTCETDDDCNLNGICSLASRTCVCDQPWSGVRCGVLSYAPTPITAKDIYNQSNPSNTWGGPIVGPEEDGKYHAFIPHYNKGKLFGAKHILHGTADDIEGPYSWSTMTSVAGGINPAFLVFPNASDGGKSVYSLWVRGKIHVSDSASGPFRVLEGVSYPNAPNANPAPIYHNGAFYLTTQHTNTVWTRAHLLPDLADPDGGWVVFAQISHEGVPAGVTPEDPFMYVDARGNWHIINHAYDVNQTTNCGASALSLHFFSSDGKAWRCSTREPYGHTVLFDDGSNHTYTTLERPYLHFDAAGKMTHLVLAADLTTGDEGCASRPWPRKGPPPYGPTACTNCKYEDHAGTIVVKLKYGAEAPVSLP